MRSSYQQLARSAAVEILVVHSHERKRFAPPERRRSRSERLALSDAPPHQAGALATFDKP